MRSARFASRRPPSPYAQAKIRVQNWLVALRLTCLCAENALWIRPMSKKKDKEPGLPSKSLTAAITEVLRTRRSWSSPILPVRPSKPANPRLRPQHQTTLLALLCRQRQRRRSKAVQWWAAFHSPMVTRVQIIWSSETRVLKNWSALWPTTKTN